MRTPSKRVYEMRFFNGEKLVATSPVFPDMDSVNWEEDVFNNATFTNAECAQLVVTKGRRIVWVETRYK